MHHVILAVAQTADGSQAEGNPVVGFLIIAAIIFICWCFFGGGGKKKPVHYAEVGVKRGVVVP